MYVTASPWVRSAIDAETQAYIDAMDPGTDGARLVLVRGRDYSFTANLTAPDKTPIRVTGAVLGGVLRAVNEAVRRGW